MAIKDWHPRGSAKHQPPVGTGLRGISYPNSTPSLRPGQAWSMRRCSSRSLPCLCFSITDLPDNRPPEDECRNCGAATGAFFRAGSDLAASAIDRAPCT